MAVHYGRYIARCLALVVLCALAPGSLAAQRRAPAPAQETFQPPVVSLPAPSTTSAAPPATAPARGPAQAPGFASAPAPRTGPPLAPVGPPTTAGAPPSVAAPRSIYLRDPTPPAHVASADRAQRAPEPARFGQTLWLVSTRRLGEEGEAASFVPEVSRYAPALGWAASTLTELLQAGTRGGAKAIFVHGNDTSPVEAAQDGLELFRQLRAGMDPAREMQCVVWSWPTAPVSKRGRQTAQLNANRTNIEGFWLACFLSLIPVESPVSVSGYCSGARVATGGLHVLGGGKLDGRQLPVAPAAPARPIYATLLAPALDHDWLAPGAPHERALSQVERMTVTVNPADAVLRFYPLLWGRPGPAAMGTAGATFPTPGAAPPDRIALVNVESSLKRNHGWTYYNQSPEVIALLRQEMFDRLAPAERTSTARLSVPQGGASPRAMPSLNAPARPAR